ncbi:ABC transporter ATP-binding protein [Pengzhenrongella frigida]|uniref:ABC transporter ATP-binding protein n=1 Tax=Pengzhenrongella frigida TaxID=1259133 RepID=A0A4Q5MZ41_9MICO|nr:ABC transporter ATP-binding protein [Cellulomonas sp. HLT2-17]RYV50203.1 ABC transporter ATP-binding protein [Cellulomonas sp. HLT2-17]
MIAFEQVGVTYPGQSGPALRDIDVRVEEGELCLVIGPTGAGKSTLLQAACALVPHFTGGLLSGRVLVAGRDTRDHRPRDLADVVGVVGQDPLAGFVTDSAEEELAYGMEQLGLSPGVMRKRVEEVVDLLGLGDLRGRPLADLSGGEQQRVALGAVMTSQPRVLVLDEPTSALDPAAADEVLAAITRLVHDLGVTVLLAEHRLERVVQYADRVISLRGDGTAFDGPPAEVLASSLVVPPIVELGRLAGWDPLPLSVRDARRRAAPLRARLAGSIALVPTAKPGTGPRSAERAPVSAPVGPASSSPAVGATASEPPATAPLGAPALTVRGLHVRHGRVHAVRGVDLDVRAGEIVAVMGRNGAGKSSLLWALQGSGPRSGGSVRLAARGDGVRLAARGDGVRLAARGDGAHLPAGDVDPATLRPSQARRCVALVPQTPSDLLYLDSVHAECEAGDAQGQATTGATRSLLARIAGAVPAGAHPRDLSEGQRLALVLAVQLAAGPPVLLLDEPTRGLDYAAKRRLTQVLAERAAAGVAVVLSSHDVEFVAGCASRVIVLADGDVVADGSTRDVLVASPVFAPQVAKVLHPLELLTVDAVRAALAGDAMAAATR